MNVIRIVNSILIIKLKHIKWFTIPTKVNSNTLIYLKDQIIFLSYREMF